MQMQWVDYVSFSTQVQNPHRSWHGTTLFLPKGLRRLWLHLDNFSIMLLAQYKHLKILDGVYADFLQASFCDWLKFRFMAQIKKG